MPAAADNDARRTSSLVTELLEVEAREGGMATGVSIVSNLFGEPAIMKCRMIGRVSSPVGGYVLMEAGFPRRAGGPPIELLSGIDREGAQQALDWIDSEAQRAGWRRIRSDGHSWYSYRYSREVDLAEAKSDWQAAQPTSQPNTGRPPKKRSPVVKALALGIAGSAALTQRF